MNFNMHQSIDKTECFLRGNTTVNAKKNIFFQEFFLMEGKEIQL